MRISDWSSDVCSSDLDVLTSLEWLAGWTAYKNLGRPASAVVHFDRYSLAAQTPQTQSKGDYWAGRAAEAARQAAPARSYYQKAGSPPHPSYRQPALDPLGRPAATPPPPPPPHPPQHPPPPPP